MAWWAGDVQLEGVVTFVGTFHALRSEQCVKRAALVCRLIPSPRELHSSCAVSLAFEAAAVRHIAEVIARNRIHHEGIYLYDVGGLQRWIG